jgi:hypothetical protein
MHFSSELALTQSKTKKQDGVGLGGLPKTDRLEKEHATVSVSTTGRHLFFLSTAGFQIC